MHRLLRDWSLRQALRVGLGQEVGLRRQVLLAAVAVAVPVASSSQVVAVPAQLAAGLRQQDSSVPEHPDPHLLLPAALVLQAELVQAKPTRTRVNRDR